LKEIDKNAKFWTSKFYLRNKLNCKTNYETSISEIPNQKKEVVKNKCYETKKSLRLREMNKHIMSLIKQSSTTSKADIEL
jgi:hypothetical protein